MSKIEIIKTGITKLNVDCIVNAANEVAVQFFLDGKIKFLQIGELVRSAFEHFEYREIRSYDDVISADMAAREYVMNALK